VSPFWDWALKAYAKPGVAQACLVLQDDHGQCTPYLLWAAWAAQSGRSLDPVTLAKGADLAQRWEPAFITPVRTVRRTLKPAFDGVADDLREALRDQVKAVELAAEQTLMLSLEALTLEAPAGFASVQQALEQATALWTPSAPKNSLMGLSQHL
jgi:uncharacterized protein (TIGR02444 family)